MRFLPSKRLLVSVAPLLCALASFAGVSSASAESAAPWWHATTSVTPSYLQPGATGEVVVTVSNVGDSDANGSSAPVEIQDALPAGLEAVSLKGEVILAPLTPLQPIECSSYAAVPLTCSFTGTLHPYDQIEVTIGVKVKETAAVCQPGAATCEQNAVSVSGGGAPALAVRSPVTVSETAEAAIPFGLQDNELSFEEEGGALDTRAGSHPFQSTDTLVFNRDFQQGQNHLGQEIVTQTAPVALAKDVSVKLPPGVIGNPIPLPRCTIQQFLTHLSSSEAGHSGNACPAQTAIGVASVLVYEPAQNIRFTVPLFNLEPAYGEPARFGFYVALTQTPVLLDTSVRGGPGTGEEYAVTIGPENITQTAGLLSSEITFWGVPGSAVHNNSRGWNCLGRGGSCASGEELHPPGFLIMPTSCTGPLQSSTEVDSWAEPKPAGQRLSVPTSEALQALDGCNQLTFSPTIKAEPTTRSAASASGLDFNLDFHDEGLTSAEGTAQSQLNKTVVVLPEGFTIDPSAGLGLVGCTPADYAREAIDSAPGAGCPNESKLGTVEFETPLLTQRIDGSIYIAEPYENPFSSLVALYIVAKNPETGVMIKLAGKVEPNPVTGQLTTIFENNPQLPFDHFNFHFREGQQAPLITPATCGTYTTQAALTPWSEPLATLSDTSSFQLTSGAGGGACPAGNVAPFQPGIEAGTLNNNAGAFSSLYIHLTRSDSDQEIAGFSTDMPPGLTGDLTGIPYCPDASIEAARRVTGAQEEASPSCPAASEIGHTLVGTGVGAVLAYVPGKVYLAGSFDGDPFSIVSITSAKVGPFDLGTVVLRFGLSIDPHTAQVSVTPTSSEPIPTIIEGIVTHVRDIRVYIDRPNFILNPTSCNPLAISSTLTSSESASATVSSHFQAASCANLKFAPGFAVSTSGKTSRANGASLAVKLTYPSAPQGTQADIARVKVELPKQLPSRLTTLQKACTSAQFKANPAGCPAASVVGHAKAVTPLIPVALEGPAYFVSNGGESFPNLIMVLQGDGVTIDLVGDTFIDEKTGVTSSTFKAVPDQPVGSFELTLPEGQYSALAARGNLCKQKLTMPTEFLAQNGAEIHKTTRLAVTGCPKVKKVSHKHRAKQAKHAKKRTEHGKPGKKQ
jgi:hypothetical protein